MAAACAEEAGGPSAARCVEAMEWDGADESGVAEEAGEGGGGGNGAREMGGEAAVGQGTGGDARQGCAQSSGGGRGRKRQRAGVRQVERAVRVEGMGDVVVCSAWGVVLRLRHVVAGRTHLRRESVADAEALSRFNITDEGNKRQRRADASEGGSNRADDGGGEGEGRIAEIRRMGREALEAGLGRGGYVVGAVWDEGNMVQAMRRFGGRTIKWRYGEG